MPGGKSQKKTTANADSTNSGTQFEQQDGAGVGPGKPDGVSQSLAMPSMQKVSHRNWPAALEVGHEERQRASEEQHRNSTDSGIQERRKDELAHGGPQRPVATAIWDWETPLDGAGESVPFNFEPQGELLQEQRDRRSSRSEFSIPHVMTGFGATWPFDSPTSASSNNNNDNFNHNNNSTSTSTNDGFAVPRRPSGVPAAIAGSKRKSTSDREVPGSGNQKRTSRMMSDASDEPTSPTEGETPAQNFHCQNGGSISTILPPRKIFPIQMGDKLFRLSGASLSSDAPSYFSQFFEEQLRQNDSADNIRTLYIDRDPETFADICLHLQGYHIQPRDGQHFVKLFTDAQFFSLPRLTAQLFSSTIYIRIGEQEFQIPRDLFNNPGDSPNYFSLGFAMFFTTPSETFPGLSQRGLLRPPSILPPSVPNRSAKIFADLLHVLKGYPVEIRSEEHRQELLRDARYFHLKGLEQRLIPHQITYNLARQRSEILIRIEDIRQSGVSFVPDSASQPFNATSPASSSGGPAAASATAPPSNTPTGPGWVYYQRPYVDSEPHSLIVETHGEESTFLSVAAAPPRGPQAAAAAASAAGTARPARATFHRLTLARVTRLFGVLASKMNLPVTQPLGLMLMERGAGVASLPVSPGNTGVSEERVKVRIGSDADVWVDGKRWKGWEGEDGGEEEWEGEDEEDENGHEDEDEDDEDEDEDGNANANRMDLDPSSNGRGRVEGRKQKQSTTTATKRRGKRRRPGGGGAVPRQRESWVIRRAQWRLRVQPVASPPAPSTARTPNATGGGMEVILGAVKIEAYSCERGRNAARDFLA